jgi:hypothetical protein
VAKLKENMLELDSEPLAIPNLPSKGLKEGPWVFERNGIYYLTFPHVENKIERLEYAIGNNPMGPFKMTGVIMDESPLNCWTNHHSTIEKEGQWYLFYHQNEYSPKFDKNRSACIDSLFFNTDGTIQKVTPTFRGVGLTNATGKIEIDRYSGKSESGTSITLLNTINTFSGWKANLEKPGAWIQYNSVDFGRKGLKSVRVNSSSKTGGILEIRLNKTDGPVLARVKLRKGENWQISKAKIAGSPMGVANLVVISKSESPVLIDWMQFE